MVLAGFGEVVGPLLRLGSELEQRTASVLPAAGPDQLVHGASDALTTGELVNAHAACSSGSWRQRRGGRFERSASRTSCSVRAVPCSTPKNLPIAAAEIPALA